MNPFLERLPWRVAALAGLMVGAISFAIGADVWNCLLRVGMAFLVFGLLGLGLRAVLQQGVAGGPSPSSEGRGRHFDQMTPEETGTEPSDAASSSNDVK